MRLPLPTFRLLGLWLLALLPLATAADTKPDTRETIDLEYARPLARQLCFCLTLIAVQYPYNVSR